MSGSCGVHVRTDGTGTVWLFCTAHGYLVAMGTAPSVELVAKAAGSHALEVDGVAS